LGKSVHELIGGQKVRKDRRGGRMEFTEAEAKVQEGKWVRVRDDSLWIERIDKGAHGKVVGAQRSQREGNGRIESWSVCIECYLSHDHSLSVLLHNIGKEQYVGAFEEIPAERSLQNAGGPKCSHPLKQLISAARDKTLTLVSSSGLMKE
jgi:hypothetical protein